MSIKTIVVTVKCEDCEKETSTLIPLVISEDDWRRTQQKYGGELITHRIG